GIQNEAAKIGDRSIDLIDFRFPPCIDGGIERIKSVESAERLRASEVHGDSYFHTPRPKHVGNADDLRQHIGTEDARIRIDIVDRTTVDPNRGQHPAVVSNAAQVFSNMSVLPEDGGAAVSTLNRSVQLV